MSLVSAALALLAAGAVSAQSPAPPKPPVPLPNVPDIEDMAPEQIGARLGVATPCPAGLVHYSANDIAMLRIPGCGRRCT